MIFVFGRAPQNLTTALSELGDNHAKELRKDVVISHKPVIGPRQAIPREHAGFGIPNARF